MAMTARDSPNFLRSVQASEVSALQDYLKDTGLEVRRFLDAGKRVVVEGTQGFGLSLLLGGYWPKATSRDTTAAGFLAEAGAEPARRGRCDLGDSMPSDPRGGRLRAADQRDQLEADCC